MTNLPASKRILMAAIAAVPFAGTCCAHDSTWHAIEAAQPRREAVLIASGVPLVALAAAQVERTTTCRLRLQLLDADSRKPRAGLVRVLRGDGSALQINGLLSHGTALPGEHAGRDWHAVLQPCEIEVPREALRIEAIGGLETERAVQTLDLSAREKADVALPLVRFSDVAARGWRAGNTHLHLRNLTRAQAEEYLRTLPRADGLEMMFVSHLLRHKEDARYISNAFTAADVRALSGGGVTFGWGEEMRHNFGAGGEGYGHVMLLNLPRLVEPVSIGPGITGGGRDFPPLRPGIVTARKEGGSVIWCHNSFGFEDIPNWLAGLVHAQNIFDGGTTGSYAESHYRYLNAGLRVPFSTGTDWFLYDFARVYARLEEPLTERGWLAGLAKGRSFITNGPLLDLDVAGRRIGDTIDVAQSRALAVKGRAAGRVDFKAVELVHNGRVIARAASRAVGGHFEAELAHELRADDPGWLALRVPSRAGQTEGTEPRSECGEVLFAHTSPVYLEAAGRARRDAAAVASLLEDLTKARAEILAKGKFADDAQREEVMRLYDGAEKTLRR